MGMFHWILLLIDKMLLSRGCVWLTGVSHWQVCVTDRCDWLTGASDWQVCLTDRCVSLTGVSHWRVCLTERCVWLTGVCDWQMCLTDRCVWLTGVCDWQMCLIDRCVEWNCQFSQQCRWFRVSSACWTSHTRTGRYNVVITGRQWLVQVWVVSLMGFGKVM